RRRAVFDISDRQPHDGVLHRSARQTDRNGPRCRRRVSGRPFPVDPTRSDLHLEEIRNAHAIYLPRHRLVSTQAVSLQEHGLYQVTDGLGHWLGGGGAADKGVDKTPEYLDGAGLAGLERKALASLILVRDAVQRHLLLLQPGQDPSFIGSALASARRP